MYPQLTNHSPSTSTSAPRPTSIFEPSSPQQLTDKQSTESSPQSSLPCGQRTPAGSTTTSDAPSSHTPPQPFVHSQHQPKIPTPTHHTSPKPHKQQIQQTPVKTNVNPPTQPPISDEEQQCVPKLTNGSQVKRSKQQPRQQEECLCFYCNQPGHLKRNCPEIPYCSKCRTRGHAPDRCTSKPQRNRHTRQTGESRDQQKRNEDLPQFSSRHNRCLHCAGDHPTANCTTTWQRQTPTTNSPASGTGTSIHQNAPNTSHLSSHPNSQSPATHSQSTIHVKMPTLNINTPPFPSNLHQAPPPPLAQNNQSTNCHTNQQQMHTPPTQPFNAQLPQSFNPHVPPPYFPQYPPTNSPSAHSTDSLILLALQKQWERQERLDTERNTMEKQKEERKRMKEEREQRKQDRKRVEKCKNQQRSQINKAFKKIPRFHGTNPSYCFDWLEQTEALVNEHQGRIYRKELLLNCGTSMSKTIHALPQGATNQHIKDAVLRNHSNLRTVSQRSNTYHQLHQKPDEALQTYNTRYASFFNLAYPELELDNPLSRMHCIHYASSLYGKLGDEMTGRFNQDLPENLQTAFEKATNFEPRIVTKQSINNRKIHEVNHIDITHGEDEVEIEEAHVRNPNYKGKNYNPNYQQNRTKMTNNTTTNTASNHHNNSNQGYGSSSHHNNSNPGYGSSSHHNNSNPGYGYNKTNQQEKPVNVSVTLHGPVSKEQLYKIQEVLRHPSQYRDRIKPEDHPVKGEYANAFNKFRPKKVEVNEATMEKAIKYAIS